MTLKTFKKIDKKGHEEIWEWEETPELRAFIKKQSLIITLWHSSGIQSHVNMYL
jgi:hypothetical protein